MLERVLNEYTAVSLGSFDGLHRGHQAVIMNAVKQKEHGLVPVVLLFDEHPLKFIKNKAPNSLITREDLIFQINSLGAEIYEISFKSIMDMSPEQFVDKILCSTLKAKAVSCGFNYRFGKNSSGDVQILKKLCDNRKIQLIVADSVNYNGLPVSSTRIRDAVTNGEMLSAAEMLGRPYGYALDVVSGDHIGRKLGFPTINQLFPENFTIPKTGVYAAAAHVDSKTYPAVTNIGVRPTVSDMTCPRSETNIIGFNADLYGKKIKIQLFKYLRNEKKFASLDDLKLQIKQDGENAAEIFKLFVKKK